jgi:DNA-binding transcriptional MerR regulator
MTIIAEIPQKYYYTIGDACQLTGTKPHILRYWESQFKLLRPARRYSGHRKYTQNDIDLINRIRYLVIDRKFTLAGAKREINRQLGLGTKETQPTDAKKSAPNDVALLREIKKEIQECLDILQPKQPDLAGLSS